MHFRQFESASKNVSSSSCRLERSRRQLKTIIPGQSSIAFYFPPLLGLTEKLFEEINSLKAELSALQSVNKSETVPIEIFNNSPLLKDMIASLRTNAGRQKEGNRFPESLKLFCSYVYTIGGPLLHDILSQNFVKAMPSLDSSKRTLSVMSVKITEAIFRFRELRDYWLSV